MFRVSIASLDFGSHTVTEYPSPEDLGLAPDAFSDVEVTIALDVGDKRVLADFDVAALANLTCDRTLEPFDERIEGRHTVLFVSPELAPDGGETDSLKILPAEAVEVDLTEPVRDTLLLAVPLRKVSPAAQAEPLPTTFGAPANDSGSGPDHWAALRTLASGSDDAPNPSD